MIWLLPATGILCFLIGLWFGGKTAALLRHKFMRALTEMDRNVDELSRHMHDGRLAPAAVHGFIGAIRSEFTLRWERPH